MADAMQPQGDRDLARDHPDDRHRDRIRRHLAQRVGEELAVLPLPDLDAAGAAADDDPGAGLVQMKSRVRPRLTRGDHAGERGSRITARVGVIVAVAVARRQRRDVRSLVDRNVRQGCRDLAGKVGDIEFIDRARPAGAACHRLPVALATDAEGRHDADPGNGDPRIRWRAHM